VGKYLIGKLFQVKNNSVCFTLIFIHLWLKLTLIFIHDFDFGYKRAVCEGQNIKKDMVVVLF